MAAIDRFLLLVRSLRRDQRGMALPTALMALIATFALASVAVMSTVNTQRGTARDHDSKEAIAAADAGAGVAMLRLNRHLPELDPALPCISPTGLAQTSSGGWCPKTTAEKVGDAEFSYQVSAFGASKAVQVIAWGSSGGVTRRVNVGLQAIDGKNVFADEKVIGEEGIEFTGSSTEVDASLGTNGEITRTGSSHPEICGNGRHGIGKGPVPPLSCGGVESEGNMTLPPVVMPDNLESVNDDCRLYEQVTAPCTGIDLYYGQGKAKRSATVPWDPNSKKIEVNNPQSYLSLGGQNYFVCKLIISNGQLLVPFNSNVNIYVAPPQSCDLPANSVQVEVAGEILSSAFIPSQQSYVIPNIYLLGESKVYVKGNGSGGKGSSEFTIYGPKSTVEFQGGTYWNGMVAAKKVIVQGNVKLESSSKFQLPDQSLAPLFQRTRYVECGAAAVSSPAANC
jgi:hypothetical protein